MTKPKTPQEKKRLSYEKDRRNTYGERGSHSRYAIAFQKTTNRRTDRHRAEQALQAAATNSGESLDQAEIKVKTIPKRDWRKYPDTPLREVVKNKLEYRMKKGINETRKILIKGRGSKS
jgi:hypothetical protein